MTKKTNTQAMQVVGQRVDKGVVRHYPGDTNLKQMSMGSWHANLSKGGVPNEKLGRNHTAGGSLAIQTKGKK